jgi:hypothetical protein
MNLPKAACQTAHNSHKARDIKWQFNLDLSTLKAFAVANLERLIERCTFSGVVQRLNQSVA